MKINSYLTKCNFFLYKFFSLPVSPMFYSIGLLYFHDCKYLAFCQMRLVLKFVLPF